MAVRPHQASLIGEDGRLGAVPEAQLGQDLPRTASGNGTDHASYQEQGVMIRRYIAWRNHHARDEHLGRIAKRAKVA
jgi:hypothetical protein